jgi:hypothetical protein
MVTDNPALSSLWILSSAAVGLSVLGRMRITARGFFPRCTRLESVTVPASGDA